MYVCVSHRAEQWKPSLDSRTQVHKCCNTKQLSAMLDTKKRHAHKHHISALLLKFTSHQSNLLQHFSPTWLQFAPCTHTRTHMKGKSGHKLMIFDSLITGNHANFWSNHGDRGLTEQWGKARTERKKKYRTGRTESKQQGKNKDTQILINSLYYLEYLVIHHKRLL